ncbi:hypothetical protein [Loktanella sp. SALINAS62]|uniref:hypothetical protein n=1 Tax=Loktanella sp. SALINAS62 TaxID=2706124 RepID=UPI001B8D8A0D|nr:hypothetical protein [Loktanella sp. SALINAS62]MBS1304333.1 hypothetical protein [Loktanella sp. SALINAS62]
MKNAPDCRRFTCAPSSIGSPAPSDRGTETGLTTGRVLGALGLAAAGFLVLRAAERNRLQPQKQADRSRRADAAIQMGRASSLLAGSVFADSAMEHLRGGYHRRAMYVAPAMAGATLAASTSSRARLSRRNADLRDGIYLAGIATGLTGLGFHLWNISKRPGGATRMNNFFYAAPIGAPGALVASGLYGLAAGRLVRAPQMTSRQEGRLVGSMTALNILATSAEAGLLHFRSAFQNPVMFLPVIAPPAAAVALAAAVARPGRQMIKIARAACGTTVATGLAGAAFHVWGVHRMHGGWHNWRQNLLAGPPIAAPPSFAGLGLAGLGALDLLEMEAQP